MEKKLTNTEVVSYKNPFEGEITLAKSPNVWPPYSAFYFAESTLPIAHKVLSTPLNRTPVCIDIGTGSGVLSILAKKFIPTLTIVATDLNPAAVKLAEYNWNLNNLPEADLTTIVADGISEEVVKLLQAQEGADVLLANLPQQPLIKGLDLVQLREKQASAWNIDANGDPDGLGIFQKVLNTAHQIMRPGGVAMVSASSKQNISRVETLLKKLVSKGHASRWEIISKKKFNIPPDYDPSLIKYWQEREEQDKVKRLFPGSDGNLQYVHYNIAVYF